MGDRRRERGFAVAAAVAACLVFAYVSLDVIARTRAGTLQAGAERVRARLAAAADAGLVLAMDGLADTDPIRRWPLAGPPRTLAFDGVQLTIQVEDEQGKIPLNQANPETIERLLSAAGVEGDRLDSLADTILDWRDSDEQARRPGTEAPGYRADGLPVIPRNGPFRTLEELADVRGMPAALIGRLAPALGVSLLDPGRFEPSTASPLAKAAKAGLPGGERAPAALDGRGPALDTQPPADIARHNVTIRVLAQAEGGRFTRTAVVEFTGLPQAPVRVRHYD